MRRALAGFPRTASPIESPGWRIIALAFPPDIAIRRERDVRVNRIALDDLHGIRVRFYVCPRRHSEISEFGIDGIKPAILARLHPGDVVADRPDFPTLEASRR